MFLISKLIAYIRREITFSFLSRLILLIVLITGCSENPKEKEKTPTASVDVIPNLDYKIIARIPHDTTAYTEGLFFHEQKLYESTGSPENLPFTKSIFGIVDLTNGQIDVKAELDRNKYFGEGIAMIKGRIYQLTYKNQVGFIYDSKTFKRIGSFGFNNIEGWGLTTDGVNLIMSDGTNVLTYLNPDDLTVVKTLNVSRNGYAEDNLNELEVINGFIYANVWTKDYINKIDPQSGKVVAQIDLSTLTKEAKESNNFVDVLNGIAFDSLSDKIYVTGKLWPHIFQIEFQH